MKIIDATSWERRNLGRAAWEVILDVADGERPAEVIKALHDVKYANSYICVKAQVGNLALVHALEDDGFRFVETQIEIGYDFIAQQLPKQLVRYSSYLRCEEITSENSLWDKVIDNVTDDMFITDRMYLDPAVCRGTSSLRYKNWMRDMKRDALKSMLVWRVPKTDEIVGFDIMSSFMPTSVAVLGGVFPGKTLVGMMHMCSFFEYLRGKGAQRYQTSISSNNRPMLRCYAQLGAVAQDMTYVFRKICE